MLQHCSTSSSSSHFHCIRAQAVFGPAAPAVLTSALLCHPHQVEKGVLIGGDDFKSGQTKMKSVLVDFLVGAGIKPTSIVSYNHLGNNDGKNLSAPQTFRSKVRPSSGNAASMPGARASAALRCSPSVCGVV